MPRYARSRWGSAAPTRKWMAATVIALGTIGTAWAQAGDWNQTLTVAAIGLVVQRATAYLIPNSTEEP
jgi:hypothetical protein